jgi:hypothetical protein
MSKPLVRLFLIMIALALACPLIGTEGGPPIPPAGMPPFPLPTMPAPPAAPDYTNSYFDLTWSWTGSGFSIASSGIAQSNTASTIYTGSLSAFESWQMQTVNGTLEWVKTGIIGMYSKGQNVSSKAGFSSFVSTITSTYNIPGNTLQQTAYSENSISTPVNGQQTQTVINTNTWFNGTGAIILINGASNIRVTVIAATSISYTTQSVTYDGPPGQNTTEWQIQVTTYTDLTRSLFARNTFSDTITLTTLNANNSIATQNITQQQSTFTYSVIHGANGVVQNPLLTRLMTNSQSSLVNNSQGKQTSATSNQRTWNTVNQIYTNPASGTLNVVPSSDAVSATTSSQTSADPVAITTFSRTTTWSGDGTYVLSWEASFLPGVGALALTWNEVGTLTSAQSSLGGTTTILSVSEAASAYDSYYDVESTIMQMPPPAADYPFYPSVQFSFPWG